MTDTMGRPRMDDAEAKRATIQLRATSATKDELAVHAKASGRSLSQEVERRLELSLERDREATSPAAAALLDMVRLAVSRIEAGTGKTWNEDRDTWGQVELVVRHILDLNKPPHEDDLAEAKARTRTDTIKQVEREERAKLEALEAGPGKTLGEGIANLASWGAELHNQRERYAFIANKADEAHTELADVLERRLASLEAQARKADEALGPLKSLFVIPRPQRP